jgi:hypothetical protein
MVTKGSITQLVILARYKDSSVEDVDENEVNHVEDPFMDDNTGGHVKIDPVATKVRISRCLEAAKDNSLAVEDLKPLLVSYGNSKLLNFSEKLLSAQPSLLLLIS